MSARAAIAERLYAMAARAFSRAQFDAAVTLADACLEQDPDHVDAWVLAADAHRHADREPAAVACLANAIHRAPDDRDALGRLFGLLLDLGRPSEAITIAQRLCALSLDEPAALYDLGVALSHAGRKGEAAEALTKILIADPDHAQAAFQIATIRLAQGDFINGWDLFERRHALDPSFVAPAGIARWTGDAPIKGKRLLVIPEGGHGDCVWAARFLPAVQAQGAQVVLQQRPSLANLFEGLEGIDRVAGPDAGPSGADVWAPLLSLPGLLCVTRPSAHPPARLRACPADWDGVGPLLERARGRLRVGLVWSGSVHYGGNRDRAMRLRDLEPLLDIPSIQFYSLQKGPPQAELEERGLGDLVIDANDFDFRETAALVGALDLVVMTDSAVAHIAGSLDAPVWVLLGVDPHWYFAGQDERSPWYPSMRLFRQRRFGDWAEVVKRVRMELLALSRQSIG